MHFGAQRQGHLWIPLMPLALHPCQSSQSSLCQRRTKILGTLYSLGKLTLTVKLVTITLVFTTLMISYEFLCFVFTGFGAVTRKGDIAHNMQDLDLISFLKLLELISWMHSILMFH